jgi:hypothetical protein
MSDASNEPTADRSDDRRAIIDLTLRMAEHVDQLQWDDLRSCFADDLTVAHSYVLDNGATEISAEEFIDGWRRALSGFSATQHMITNHRVNVKGDIATCSSYFRTQYVYPDGYGTNHWTLGGHYDFEFVRNGNEEGWRISELIMTGLWADGNRYILELAAERATDNRSSLDLSAHTQESTE